MKISTLITAASLALILGISGSALADEGGQPNANAYPDGTKENGRKAVCVPPGSVFKTTAKEDGSNSDPFGNGKTPGAEVVDQCQLGQPS